MTEWISVKDRLPDNDVYVLIFSTKTLFGGAQNAIYVGCYEGKKCYKPDEWIIRCECSGYEFDHDHPFVTHWMPLPEKPND